RRERAEQCFGRGDRRVLRQDEIDGDETRAQREERSVRPASEPALFRERRPIQSAIGAQPGGSRRLRQHPSHRFNALDAYTTHARASLLLQLETSFLRRITLQRRGAQDNLLRLLAAVRVIARELLRQPRARKDSKRGNRF